MFVKTRVFGFFKMFQKLLLLLGTITKYYRIFMDSPIKDTMPIFTEWLIPDALGLHTEVWIRVSAAMEGTGFHHPYRANLEVAEKEPLNWEHTRIELSWRVNKDFIIDPWQLERYQPRMSKVDGL